MQRFLQFSTKWGWRDHPPAAVAAGDLAAAEDALGIVLPEAYRTAVISAGLPRLTRALLDTIVEHEVELPDVSEFLSPEEIVSETLAWRPAGLPATLVAFANDCMGNLFAFDGTAPSGCSRVWYFDHDAGEVRVLAESFEDWIGLYCDLPLPTDDEEE